MIDEKDIIIDLQDAGILDLGITEKQKVYLFSRFEIEKEEAVMLDEKEVEKIIIILRKKLNAIDNGICKQKTGRPINDYVLNRKNAIDDAITEICKLQPKNQVVIAEGKVRNNLVGGITLVNGDKYVFVKDIVSEKLIKYKSKKGKLIWIEEERNENK